jgi:hypothetical protein
MDHEDSLRLIRKIASLLAEVAARLKPAPRAIDVERDTCRESLARIARAR